MTGFDLSCSSVDIFLGFRPLLRNVGFTISGLRTLRRLRRYEGMAAESLDCEDAIDSGLREADGTEELVSATNVAKRPVEDGL